MAAELPATIVNVHQTPRVQPAARNTSLTPGYGPTSRQWAVGGIGWSRLTLLQPELTPRAFSRTFLTPVSQWHRGRVSGIKKLRANCAPRPSRFSGSRFFCSPCCCGSDTGVKKMPAGVAAQSLQLPDSKRLLANASICSCIAGTSPPRIACRARSPIVSHSCRRSPVIGQGIGNRRTSYSRRT